jgi:uncharacterized protein YndB with AHSA1/START domain
MMTPNTQSASKSTAHGSGQSATHRARITTPSDREIRVEREFDAPRDQVWKAFTDPDLMAKWWGRGNKLVVERHELKKGGHWRYVEKANGETHAFEGRFREISPQNRIVQTFEWDELPGHVAVESIGFIDLPDGRTRVVETSLFHTSEERDGMQRSGMVDGMNQSFDALDRVLATIH